MKRLFISTYLPKHAQCLKCNKRFTKVELETVHRRNCIEIKGKKDKVICIFCNKIYNNKEELLKHKNDHIVVNKPFNCYFCESYFMTMPMLKNHLSTIHNKQLTKSMTDDFKSRYCKQCSKHFLSVRVLRLHIEKGLCEPDDDSEEEVHEEKDCPLCGLHLKYRIAMRKHIEKCKVLQCPYDKCQMKTMFLDTLNSHINKFHKGKRGFRTVKNLKFYLKNSN